MDAASNDRTDRVFRIGLWGAIAFVVLKMTVGWFAGSRALIADGWHSVSDVLTNAGAWWAHRVARRPPDDDHHYGHGNAEALAGTVVGIVLSIGGCGVIWSAFHSEKRLVEGLPTGLALGMACISILVNIGLTWITFARAREIHSHGMLALARDNASDMLAGFLVIGGILLARQGVAWGEVAAAVAIGMLIIILGARSVSVGLDVLMDRVTDPNLRDTIASDAMRIDGVRKVERVRVHPLGASYRVDLEISVEPTLTVEEGHRIAHAVEDALTSTKRATLAIETVQVHVNPWYPQ